MKGKGITTGRYTDLSGHFRDVDHRYDNTKLIEFHFNLI